MESVEFKKKLYIRPKSGILLHYLVESLKFVGAPLSTTKSDVTVYWHTLGGTYTSTQDSEKFNPWRSAKTRLSGDVKLLFKW